MHLMDGLTKFRLIESNSSVTLGGIHLCFRPPTGVIAESERATLLPDPRSGTVLVDDLMWTTQDNGSDVDWNVATRYCENLTLDGDTDWRLPTEDELRGIKDLNDGYELTTTIQLGGTPTEIQSTVYTRNPIRLTSIAVWSSRRQGADEAYIVNFTGDQESAIVGYTDIDNGSGPCACEKCNDYEV